MHFFAAVHNRNALAGGAAIVWLLLFYPPLRGWFEASMLRHMIFQLPLLVAIGWLWGKWLLGHPVALRCLARLEFANRWGATGMLIAIVTMTLWMLPRLLDSARLDLGWDFAKFLSLSLLVGTAAALSWRRCPPIARGVIHLEIIATFWRFGWAYLATEERLCLSYLLGDQQRAGQALCCVGVAWALAVVWKPLFGSSLVWSPASTLANSKDGC